jgi:BlaI family transcriptional regulator, penicillinase repressor
MNNPLKPTDSELEILQILWQKGKATVREVNETLNEHKETGYTTTLKIMQIMQEKGLLQRNDSARSHVYCAVVSESLTQQALLSRFTDAVFRGSALQLVMQALGNSSTSPSELHQIKTLIEQLEQQKP